MTVVRDGSSETYETGPMTVTIARHKTAMSRNFLSRPLQQAFADGLFEPGFMFFDYGCGRGSDVRHVRQLGYEADGWDPVHAPDQTPQPAQIVNLGYVVNVIEDRKERAEALRGAWGITREVLVVSARLDWEPAAKEGKPFQDGLITKTGTFQKYFSQDELRAWIDSTLGQKSVAASPGIFYVFRSSEAEQRLLARHSRAGHGSTLGVAELIYREQASKLDPLAEWVRAKRRLPTPADVPDADELIETFGSIRSAFALVRRVTGPSEWAGVDLGTRKRSEERFEQNLEILQPLIDFLTERGRLPRDDELSDPGPLLEEFGSIRAAFSLVRRVAGSDRWAEYEQRARQDFLVYLALAAFGGRPKFGELPLDLQHDARDFFGSYKDACAEADKLLFAVGNPEAINAACREAPFGKVTPEALYVHVAGIPQLPPVLRVYIGCGETLTGSVAEATLAKLHREKPQVSFLVYPTFDKEAHPALEASIVARLRELRVSYKDFADRANPPILHRKETFVPETYPGREKFARLTAQEDRRGLLNSTTIGTRNGWTDALEAEGLQIKGHRLVRQSSKTSESSTLP